VTENVIQGVSPAAGEIGLIYFLTNSGGNNNGAKILNNTATWTNTGRILNVHPVFFQCDNQANCAGIQIIGNSWLPTDNKPVESILAGTGLVYQNNDHGGQISLIIGDDVIGTRLINNTWRQVQTGGIHGPYNTGAPYHTIVIVDPVYWSTFTYSTLPNSAFPEPLGTVHYCSDCKGTQDGASFGSAVAGRGTGTVVTNVTTAGNWTVR
jgi:hypothetical protein